MDECIYDKYTVICIAINARQWNYAWRDSEIMHDETVRLCITRHCDYALLDTAITHY